MVEKIKAILEEVALQLPSETPIDNVTPTEDPRLQILTGTLDQTLDQRPDKVVWVWGMHDIGTLRPLPPDRAHNWSLH